MARRRQDASRRSRLDGATRVEDDEPVRPLGDEAQVVTDEDHGGVAAVGRVDHQVERVGLGQDVQ